MSISWCLTFWPDREATAIIEFAGKPKSLPATPPLEGSAVGLRHAGWVFSDVWLRQKT